MGKMTEAAGYATAQVWRDADYLYKLGYADAANVLSMRAVDMCAGNVEGLCAGCGRPVAAPATVHHRPWCVHEMAGYDPTEEIEAQELAQLRALWGGE